MRRGREVAAWFSRARLAAAFAAGLALASLAGAGERSIILATTTSTENSGLLAHILPRFEAETGIKVHVVARGTGQAFRIARNGDADAILIHDRAGELEFVAEGAGVDRRDVMYNDFVIVGSRADPAGVGSMTDVVTALKAIAGSGATFISRGDDSGTHRAERRFWREAGIAVDPPSGTWYLETGAGMGTTLNVTVELAAYTLTDRGTWLSFLNRRDLVVLVQGDPRLFNPYGVILVNPERHPHVKAAEARAFIDWITGEEGQRAIADYRIGGEQPFHPSAEGQPAN